MTCTAAFNQKAYRGRNDDGSESAATWKRAQNTNWVQPPDVNFRVRFEAQETAGCAKSNFTTIQLQYNKNNAGWNNVTGSSSVVRSFASSNVTDGANTTNQLTLGTGTFVGGGGFDEVDGVAGNTNMDVAASGHFEVEYCIQIRSADAGNGDTIQLRITDGGTAFSTYDATPIITVGVSIGPFDFQTFASDSAYGSASWSNPGNAASSNDSRAIASITGNSSQYLKCTDPSGNNISDQAVVTDITITVERLRTGGLSAVQDDRLRLVIGGTVQSTDLASATAWGTTDSTVSYTFTGLSLAGSDTKGSGFGVVLAAKETASEVGSANVDHIRVSQIIYHGGLAGTCSLAITPTGVLSGTAVLTGTCSLVITPTGTLLGAGKLEGSCSLVITPTLKQEFLYGTCNLTITPTGTLQGTGKLTGSSSLVITPTGLLGSLGILEGTCSLTTTLSGILLGAGKLTGSCSLVITPTGTLLGAGQLTGTSNITIVPTGTLLGAGKLTGTSNITIVPTGTLLGTGKLTGTSSLVITPTGTLLGAGQLTGTSNITIVPTGTLLGAGKLTGTSNITIVPTGTILGAGILSGTSSITVTPTGTLLGAGKLTGTSNITIVPTGTLLGTGKLTGTSSLVITPTGTLLGAGKLTGSCSLVFTVTGDLTAGAILLFVSQTLNFKTEKESFLFRDKILTIPLIIGNLIYSDGFIRFGAKRDTLILVKPNNVTVLWGEQVVGEKNSSIIFTKTSNIRRIYYDFSIKRTLALPARNFFKNYYNDIMTVFDGQNTYLMHLLNNPSEIIEQQRQITQEYINFQAQLEGIKL